MKLLQEFRAAARELDDLRRMLENTNARPALTALTKRRAALAKNAGAASVACRAVEDLIEIFETKTSDAGGDPEPGRQAALNHCCRLRGCFNFV